MGQTIDMNISRMTGEAGVLTYLATADQATVGTAALVQFTLQAPSGFRIPDHDAKLWSVELHLSALGAGVTSLTWALYRATGQVGMIAGPVTSGIQTWPDGTKIASIVGFLGGLPYEKAPGIGVSGNLYLTIEAAGADTVAVKPYLTFTAPNNTPVGIYRGAVD